MTHHSGRLAAAWLCLLLAPRLGLAQSPETDPRRAAMLKANGFVVDGDTVVTDLDRAYSTMEHGDTVVFVTSDVMLYLWHETDRAICRDLERDRLWPLTQRLAGRLWASHQTLLAGDLPPALKAAGAAQSVKLAVAARLADGQAKLPEALVQPAEAIVARINAARDTEPYPGEDYTQYRPRGPYADDATLARYFRLAKWLGRQPIALAGDYASPDTLRQAAWLVAALRRDAGALSDCRRLLAARRLLAGDANGSDGEELDRALTAVLGRGWSLAALADDSACRRVLAELLKPGYTPLAVTTAVTLVPGQFPTRGLTLLPEHAVPDSVVIQRNFDRDPGADKPAVGLRVATALGLSAAEPLLAAQAGASDAEIAAIRADGQRLCLPAGTSVYQRWLAMLGALPQRDPRAPAFMRNAAWADKTLTTALTSWAQLRHANILYSAIPYAMAGCAVLESQEPLGWVEPLPVFWRAYAALCSGFAADLRRLDLLTPKAAHLLASLGGKSADFARLSELELAGKPLPDRGRSIRYFSSWARDLPSDKPVVVADVATDPRLGAVYAASGYFHPITALIPRLGGQGTLVGTGLVGSYYEFGRPQGQRLTDSEWQALAASDYARPEPPDWSASFTFRAADPAPEVTATLRQAQRDIIAGRDDVALTALRRLEAEHPFTELAVRARMVAAGEYQRRRDHAKLAEVLADRDQWYGCELSDEAGFMLEDLDSWLRYGARRDDEGQALQARLANTEPRPGLSEADELARQEARAAALLAGIGRDGRNIGLAGRVLTECPRSTLVPAARLIVALSAVGIEDGAAADLRPLEAVERDFAGSWLAEKAAAVCAQVQAKEKPDAAFDRLQPYLSAQPHAEPYPAAVKAARQVFAGPFGDQHEQSPAREVLSEMRYDLLEQAFHAGRFDRFETIARALAEDITRGSESELVDFVRYFAPKEPEALRLWARSAETDSGPSAAALRELLARYPRAELAPWALYSLTDPDRSNAEPAAAQLRDIARLQRDYPGSAAALFRAADLARRAGDRARAGELDREAQAKIKDWPPAQLLAGYRRLPQNEDAAGPGEADLAPWRTAFPGLDSKALESAVDRMRAGGDSEPRVIAWVADLRRLLPLTTEELIHYAAAVSHTYEPLWATALDELCRKAGGPRSPRAAELLLAADRACQDRSRGDLTAAERFVTAFPADPRAAEPRLRLISAGHEPFLTTALAAAPGPEFEAAIREFEARHGVRDGFRRKGLYTQHRREMEALAAKQHGQPTATVALLTVAGQLLRHGWAEQAVDCYVKAAAEAAGGHLAARAAAGLAAARTVVANKRRPLRPAWTVAVSAPVDRWAFRDMGRGALPSMVLDAERVYAAVPLAGGQYGLMAARRDTGALVWRVPLGRAAALAVGPGTVYCAVADKLLALDPATGGLRWQVARAGVALAPLPDGLVQHTGHALRRLRARDGSVVWERPCDRLAEGAPLVVGERLLVATAGAGYEDHAFPSGWLRALALADGAPLWQVHLGEDGNEDTVARPLRQPWLRADGSVMLAHEGGRVPDGQTFARFDPASGRRLDERTGNERMNCPGWDDRSVAVGDAYVLVGTDDNDDTVCYALAGAAAAWREDRSVDRGDLGHALVANVPGGFLFVRDRLLSLREPSTGASLRRMTLPSAVRCMAVDGSTVYGLTEEGELLRVDLGEAAADGGTGR